LILTFQTHLCARFNKFREATTRCLFPLAAAAVAVTGHGVRVFEPLRATPLLFIIVVCNAKSRVALCFVKVGAKSLHVYSMLRRVT
jgi:hypothetical protein